MTTLQLVLAGLGILLVLGVMLYNAYQERKYRKAARQAIGQAADDLLLGERPAQAAGHPMDLGEASHLEADRIEPRIQWAMADEAMPEAEALPEFEEAELPAPPPVKPEAARPASVPPEPAQPFAPESPLDTETEYIARLRFGQAVVLPFGTLLDALRQVGKPVRAMGLCGDGVWEPMLGPSRDPCTAVELGLQLTDRAGAVATSQIEAFCNTLYAFAAEHGGAVSCPERQAALARAQALDAFCIDVDVLIGLNVVAPDSRPFRLGEIQGLAAEAGMVLQADGSYALKDEQGRLLYVLANQDERPFQPNDRAAVSHGVTLLFDVPKVAAGLEAFDHMADQAFRMAKALGGRLVDDNGKLLSHENLHMIRQRLAQAYASMQARGIPAGGERANRVFV